MIGSTVARRAMETELFQRAVSCHRQGRLAEAAELYQRLLARRPDAVNLLVNYGLLRRELGELAEAGRVLERAVALAPANASAWLALGAVRQEAGDLHGAREATGRAIVLAPTDSRAWNNQGKILHLLGDNQRARACLQRAVALDPAYAVAHGNLGVVLGALGETAAAAAALERARRLRPRDPHILYNLGSVLALLGQHEEAAACFDALLAEDPGHQAARHMRAALRGETPATPAPPSYVSALFDQYAGRFENHLTTTLGYTAPAAMVQLVQEVGQRRFPTAVDLGCGTGLAGVAFRPVVDELWGVDLSRAMLAQARAKGVYDHLEEGDIVAFLAGAGTARFQLAIAADVLIYQADLAGFFAAAATALAAGGLLVASVERAGDGEAGERGYVLRPSGRFAHHPAYVLAAAAAAGLDQLRRRTVDLRREAGGWLGGEIFVFCRP